jgi:hypothetical protein
LLGSLCRDDDVDAEIIIRYSSLLLEREIFQTSFGALLTLVMRKVISASAPWTLYHRCVLRPLSRLTGFCYTRQRPNSVEKGLLEGRAEATIVGEFNSQGVANTVWAHATMGRKPGERLTGLLEGRAEAIAGEFNSQAP